jgi:hypothetical protein
MNLIVVRAIVFQDVPAMRDGESLYFEISIDTSVGEGINFKPHAIWRVSGIIAE